MIERHFDTETETEYLELEDGSFVGEQTTLAACPKCERYMQARGFDRFGVRIEEYSRDEEEESEHVCSNCLLEKYHESLDQRTLGILEEIGLSEDKRKALASVAELVDKNPDRLLQIAQVHGKVDELERRLEDRTDSIEREVRSKLHASSISLNVAIAAGGFLAGVVVTLLSALLTT